MINYQKELEKKLEAENRQLKEPRVLLHACCAPCLSSCLAVLDRYAFVTVFFYNPNITVKEEYELRLHEVKRLIGLMPLKHEVLLKEGPYDPEQFLLMSRGLENEPERGRRCEGCYRMRLSVTAGEAQRGGYDYFATTLTLSPLKPAGIINAIGLEIAGEDSEGAKYLPSDFKKNDGYLRSIELSKEYGLYRQNYCGCIFSRR